MALIETPITGGMSNAPNGAPTVHADERPLAMSFMQQATNHKRKVFLTSKQLYIYHDGRLKAIEIENIKMLGFGFERLTLPLVLGGIVSPLSALALYAGVMSMWLNLFLFFGGILCFYLGWLGTQTFMVYTPIKTYSFAVNHISQNLKAFVRFANRHLRQLHNQQENPTTELLFYMLPKAQWESLQKNEQTHIKPVAGQQSLQLLDHDLLPNTPPQEDWLLLHLDIHQLGQEIEYVQQEEGGKLYPYLHGPLPLKAVIKVSSPTTVAYPGTSGKSTNVQTLASTGRL